MVMDLENDYANPEVTERVDLQAIITENAPFNKLAFGCIADNMRLPFEDSTFEAYVSNLSLMIVQHRERMISEAFRVLKNGTRACFSIWGRRSHCQMFTIVHQAMRNIGKEPSKDSDRFFALSADFNALR